MLESREWSIVSSQDFRWETLTGRAALADYAAGDHIGCAKSECAPGHEAWRHLFFASGQSSIHYDQASKPIWMVCGYGQADQPTPILTHQSDLSEVEGLDERFNCLVVQAETVILNLSELV